MSVEIKVTPLPNADIWDVTNDIVRIANLLGAECVCMFRGGVELRGRPGDGGERIIEMIKEYSGDV